MLIDFPNFFFFEFFFWERTTYSEAHVRNWMNPVGERPIYVFGNFPFFENPLFFKNLPCFKKTLHFWGTSNFFGNPLFFGTLNFLGKTHLFLGNCPFLGTPPFLKNFHIFENPWCFGNFPYSWDQFSNLKELFNCKVFLGAQSKANLIILFS